MTYREKGVQALSTVISSEKNIRIIEKNIFLISKDGENEEDIENDYKRYLMQIISDIKSSKPLKTILSSIKAKKVGWEHEEFEEIRIKQEEQDGYVINPFEVEEGIVTCPSCGSKRTISFPVQTRSCDEGTSISSSCVECKHSWIASG